MVLRIYRASSRWSQRQADERLDYPDADWPDAPPPAPCADAVWSPTLAWWLVVVENLEELIELSDSIGHPIIIRNDGDRVLVVYDDYLE